MEATGFPETLLAIYQTTQHQIPETINLHGTVFSSQELVILTGYRENKSKNNA
jgi:hypothetical protein